MCFRRPSPPAAYHKGFARARGTVQGGCCAGRRGPFEAVWPAGDSQSVSGEIVADRTFSSLCAQFFVSARRRPPLTRRLARPIPSIGGKLRPISAAAWNPPQGSNYGYLSPRVGLIPGGASTTARDPPPGNTPPERSTTTATIRSGAGSFRDARRGLILGESHCRNI